MDSILLKWFRCGFVYDRCGYTVKKEVTVIFNKVPSTLQSRISMLKLAQSYGYDLTVGWSDATKRSGQWLIKA